MKFVCDGLSLAEAVLKVSKACAVRTTAPIMECIKLTALGEEVSLLATDGELSIRKTVKAEIFEEGEICVPGKLFADFIGKLAGEEVCIATGEKGVEIKYRDAGTFMQSLPAEEFPAISFEIGENSFTMKQSALKKIINETWSSAISSKWSRSTDTASRSRPRPFLQRAANAASSAPPAPSPRSRRCWKRTTKRSPSSRRAACCS